MRNMMGLSFSTNMGLSFSTNMGLSFSTPCAGVRGNERALFELEENVLFVCSNIAE